MDSKRGRQLTFALSMFGLSRLLNAFVIEYKLRNYLKQTKQGKENSLQIVEKKQFSLCFGREKIFHVFSQPLLSVNEFY